MTSSKLAANARALHAQVSPQHHRDRYSPQTVDRALLTSQRDTVNHSLTRTVVQKRIERRLRNGIHRVWPDEFINIKDIRVRRILSTGRCPQRSLHPGARAASASQRGPENAFKKFW